MPEASVADVEAEAPAVAEMDVDGDTGGDGAGLEIEEVVVSTTSAYHDLKLDILHHLNEERGREG